MSTGNIPDVGGAFNPPDCSDTVLTGADAPNCGSPRGASATVDGAAAAIGSSTGVAMGLAASESTVGAAGTAGTAGIAELGAVSVGSNGDAIGETETSTAGAGMGVKAPAPAFIHIYRSVPIYRNEVRNFEHVHACCRCCDIDTRAKNARSRKE